VTRKVTGDSTGPIRAISSRRRFLPIGSPAARRLLGPRGPERANIFKTNLQFAGGRVFTPTPPDISSPPRRLRWETQVQPASSGKRAARACSRSKPATAGTVFASRTNVIGTSRRRVVRDEQFIGLGQKLTVIGGFSADQLSGNGDRNQPARYPSGSQRSYRFRTLASTINEVMKDRGRMGQDGQPAALRATRGGFERGHCDRRPSPAW